MHISQYLFYIIILLVYTFNSQDFISSKKAIILPLKYSNNNDINIFGFKNLYTSIKIGEPPKNLFIFFDEVDSGFALRDGLCLPENNYSISNSSSFKFDKGLNQQYIKYELKTILNNTRDKIYLNPFKNSNLNNIEINDFNFTYIPNKDEIYKIKNIQNNSNIDNDISYNFFGLKCGYIGILPQGINMGLIHAKSNFFYQLKQKKIIDNYYWFINHKEENNNLELIIGATPDEIFPEKYIREDLIMTSAKLVNELFLWEIHFSSVDLVNEISDKKYNFGAVYGVLSLNEEYIFCSKEFFNSIQNIFFRPFLETNKCKIENLKDDITKYNIIFCDEEYLNDDEIKKFPNLLMKSNELNFVFNFYFKDLFDKINNKYIFKIVYSGEFGFWKIGKLFLKKYQFLFNYDLKMFGLYKKIISKPNEKNIINGKTGNNFGKIVFIMILIIISIFIGVCFFRKISFSKKIKSDNIEYRKFGKKGKKNKSLLINANEYI